MTDRVLTDAEIRRIGDQTQVHRDAAHIAESFARAVEAAVLAKRPKPVYELLLSEWVPHNVEKLEKAGYVVIGVHGEPNPILLPTVKRPRTARLDNGMTICLVDDGRWQYSKPNGGVGYKMGPPFFWADTPADARLLADLVESPYEEVPDEP